MPVRVRKVRGGWAVYTPGRRHARRTTKAKAQRQARLLRAVDHGWTPTRRRRARR